MIPKPDFTEMVGPRNHTLLDACDRMRALGAVYLEVEDIIELGQTELRGWKEWPYGD